VDPAVGEQQVNSLHGVKAKRNNDAVAECLKKLEAACHTDENLMPYILAAVKEYGTLGEICDVMRGVFGEFRERG
jgi:methylmalonyl-CoA mutase N-terminal domain/subunit